MAAGFFCLLISPAWVFAQCPPKAQTETSLLAFKKSEFLVPDDSARQMLARALLPCLSLPNPVLRDVLAEKEWLARMDNLMKPTPLAKWDDAFPSSAGLARRHSLQAFLLLMYANTLQKLL